MNAQEMQSFCEKWALLWGTPAQPTAPTHHHGANTHGNNQPSSNPGCPQQQTDLCRRICLFFNQHRFLCAVNTISELQVQRVVPIRNPSSPSSRVQIMSSTTALSVQLFLITLRYCCLNVSCTKKQLLFRFFLRNHYNTLIITYLSEEDNTDSCCFKGHFVHVARAVTCTSRAETSLSSGSSISPALHGSAVPNSHRLTQTGPSHLCTLW